MNPSPQDMIIQNINHNLKLCQKLDMQIVEFQGYICCSNLAQQLNQEKSTHINRFFTLQAIIPIVKELNEQIKEPVLNIYPEVEYIGQNVCYFKLTNKDEFKQYNGYYIHEDLYLLFIQWLNPLKFLQYQQLSNLQSKVSVLQGTIDIEEAIEEKNQQIKDLEEQLKQKDVSFQQFIKERSINKIYYMTNKSLPGVCKLGTSQNPYRRAMELNSDINYQQQEKWECKCYVPVLNGLYAEDILKKMESERHLRLELYKDQGIEYYKQLFQTVKNAELGIEQKQENQVQEVMKKITYAQVKQDNIQSDKMHYIQVQVKKYNLKDSEPETIREDIINSKDIVGLQLRVNAFNFYFPELKIDLQDKIQQEKDRKIKIRTLINIHKLPKTNNPQQEIKNDIQKRIDQLQVHGLQQYLDSYSKLFSDDIEFTDRIQSDIERINKFNCYLNTIFQRNKIKNRTFQGIKDSLTQERIEQIKNTALNNYNIVLV